MEIDFNQIQDMLEVRFNLPSDEVNQKKLSMLANSLMSKIILDANFKTSMQFPEHYGYIFNELLAFAYINEDLLYQDYTDIKDKANKGTGSISSISIGDTSTSYSKESSKSKTSDPNAFIDDASERFNKLYLRLIERIRVLRW